MVAEVRAADGSESASLRRWSSDSVRVVAAVFRCFSSGWWCPSVCGRTRECLRANVSGPTGVPGACKWRKQSRELQADKATRHTEREHTALFGIPLQLLNRVIEFKLHSERSEAAEHGKRAVPKVLAEFGDDGWHGGGLRGRRTHTGCVCGTHEYTHEYERI